MQQRRRKFDSSNKKITPWKGEGSRAYATAVDASNAWKARAENAELKLASKLLKKHNSTQKKRTAAKLIEKGVQISVLQISPNDPFTARGWNMIEQYTKKFSEKEEMSHLLSNDGNKLNMQKG